MGGGDHPGPLVFLSARVSGVCQAKASGPPHVLICLASSRWRFSIDWHRIGFVDYPMIILQFVQLGAVVVVACFPVFLRLSYTLRVAEDTR